MNFKVKAVVLKQTKYLENQKYLDILTPKNGILNVKLSVRGQVTKNIFSSICVSGFYEFNLFSSRFGTVVDSVDEIEIFFNLRFNPKRFALSQYFCELSYILNMSLEDSKKQQQLLLNTLWILSNYDNFSCEFLKAVFELKLIAYSGYMLNLVCCKFCCCYEKSSMFLNISNGILICKDCLQNNRFNNDKLVLLSKAVLYAMRFVIYKKDKDIFKFKLSENNLYLFGKITEYIVLRFVERQPLALKIYKEFEKGFKFE